MIAHLLRAIFRRIDARIDRMVAAALDDDLCAVMDATAEPEVAQMHRESTPEFDRLVRHFADAREATYGDEDMAEWDRELMFEEGR